MLAKTLTFLLLTTTALAAAVPNPEPHPDSHPPTCGTCTPLGGHNDCHPSTSCINTGKRFHCACRAGYKVKHAHDDDITHHFRLPVENYEFLVFTDPGEECNALCDEWTQPPPKLCSEVKLQEHCPI